MGRWNWGIALVCLETTVPALNAVLNCFAPASTQACATVAVACREYERFTAAVNLVAFKPFASAADALEQINGISESQVPDDLRDFLLSNLPKVGCLAFGWSHSVANVSMRNIAV